MTEQSRTPRAELPLLLLYTAGLIAIGTLRWAAINIESMERFAGIPSPAYIVLTVLMALRLSRGPIGWRNMGFGVYFKPLIHIPLGIAGAAAIVLAGDIFEPPWESIFGVTRDISRFDAVITLPGLIAFLTLTWTFAAFGEEFAFRGVIQGGVRTALGGGAGAAFVAFIIQAIAFGLIHSYQGPTGIAGTTLSGLIYGALVLLARGSLWPAVFAHGFANSFSLVSLYLAAQ